MPVLTSVYLQSLLVAKKTLATSFIRLRRRGSFPWWEQRSKERKRLLVSLQTSLLTELNKNVCESSLTQYTCSTAHAYKRLTSFTTYFSRFSTVFSFRVPCNVTHGGQTTHCQTSCTIAKSEQTIHKGSKSNTTYRQIQQINILPRPPTCLTLCRSLLTKFTSTNIGGGAEPEYGIWVFYEYLFRTNT